MAGTLVDTNVLNAGVQMGMEVLRENLALARVVNSNKGDILPREQGEVVKIAIPADVTTVSITPDVVEAAITAVTPTAVAVTVDQHKRAPFAMSDKAVYQIDKGIIPMQLGAAAKSLANYIDAYLWGLTHDADGFYGYSGVAGTTPFGTDLDAFYQANRQADEQNMPVDDRFMFVNPAAKANALQIRAAFDASMRGGGDNLVKGQIGELGGCEWIMSQTVPSHTSGGATSSTLDSTDYSLGTKTLTLASAGTNAFLVGDIITISGDTQTYVITSGDADVSGGGTISIEPGLQVAITDNTLAITIKATHRSNLLMHRDAIAFAMASLEGTAQTAQAQANQAIAVDQESGLALRLKVTDQHYQTGFAFDALYGGKVARREFGVRLGG